MSKARIGSAIAKLGLVNVRKRCEIRPRFACSVARALDDSGTGAQALAIHRGRPVRESQIRNTVFKANGYVELATTDVRLGAEPSTTEYSACSRRSLVAASLEARITNSGASQRSGAMRAASFLANRRQPWRLATHGSRSAAWKCSRRNVRANGTKE